MDKRLNFKFLLTPEGMLHDKSVVVDAAGRISGIEPVDGNYHGYLALPGMPNAHSHVFQRALSGYGEARAGDDSFWTWRNAMYQLANSVSAEDVHCIARHAFIEMLRAGFTTVVEFHYLHHPLNGERGTEMARAVIDAAEDGSGVGKSGRRCGNRLVTPTSLAPW